MGEVAVLQPHDCLPNHHRRRPPSSPLKTPQKVIPNHPRRKKTTPRPSPPPTAPSSNNLVMGQVKILRRGDHLPGSTPPHPTGEGLLPLPTPQVEVVQIRLPFVGPSRPDHVNGFYAGSAAFVASPPPSSVPLPGFFAKRGGEGGGLAACDSATSDLRRILRLD